MKGWERAAILPLSLILFSSHALGAGILGATLLAGVVY